jgi:hypothetical protein
VVEGKEACVWPKDIASTFLNQELLPGPFEAGLVLEFGPERRIKFEGGHFLALAASLIEILSFWVADRSELACESTDGEDPRLP